MIFDKALNLFPTEIWEMIVEYLFKSDFEENELNSLQVCESIGLPFYPLVPRMMNRLLIEIRQEALFRLNQDFHYNDRIFQSPSYIKYYSHLGRFCSKIQFTLPHGFVDKILNEFMDKQEKGSWQQLHLAHRRLEVLDYSLDWESENFYLIQEWIQFIYMFLFSNIFPEKAFLRMNFEAHVSLQKQLGSRFHNRHYESDSEEEELLDLWRADYL